MLFQLSNFHHFTINRSILVQFLQYLYQFACKIHGKQEYRHKNCLRCRLTHENRQRKKPEKAANAVKSKTVPDTLNLTTPVDRASSKTYTLLKTTSFYADFNTIYSEKHQFLIGNMMF